MKTFASLSKKQIILYRDFLDDLKDFLEHSEGIQRRGLILSSLDEMQAALQSSRPVPGAREDSRNSTAANSNASGKLCETVLEKREKMLSSRNSGKSPRLSMTS